MFQKTTDAHNKIEVEGSSSGIPYFFASLIFVRLSFCLPRRQFDVKPPLPRGVGGILRTERPHQKQVLGDEW